MYLVKKISIVSLVFPFLSSPSPPPMPSLTSGEAGENDTGMSLGYFIRIMVLVRTVSPAVRR